MTVVVAVAVVFTALLQPSAKVVFAVILLLSRVPLAGRPVRFRPPPEMAHAAAFVAVQLSVV